MMVQLMRGRGVTPGLDMNSFAPHIVSRYGRGRACFTGETPERLRGHADDEPPKVYATWPEDFTARDCQDNSNRRGPPIEPWDDDCPSTRSVKGQFAEHSGVEYDDYAARPSVPSPYVVTAPQRTLVARDATEFRDDKAPRAPREESVSIGGGGALRQQAPLIKWKNPDATDLGERSTGWDINLDGVRHMGMLPDLWQDMRNVGVSWEQLGPLFNAAEDFIAMWERGCRLAEEHRDREGTGPAIICR
jgi:hypothetical protein